MSKSKRRQEPDNQPVGSIRPLKQSEKWWFAEQQAINELITDAIDGDMDDKRALPLYMDFVRRGWADLGRLIPEQMASGARMLEAVKRDEYGKLLVSNHDMIATYPTILTWLEDFLDAKPVPVDKSGADIIAYVAAANTCGIRTGEVIVCDAARPWDFNGEKEFVGLTLYYRKGVK